MKVFYNNIITYLHELSKLERVALLGVALILTIFSIYNLVKTFYNAKKFSFKIGPIILTAVLLAITIFLAVA